jgi:hypothetical protein
LDCSAGTWLRAGESEAATVAAGKLHAAAINSMNDQCRLSQAISSARFRTGKRAGRSPTQQRVQGLRRIDVKKLFAISGTVIGLTLSLFVPLHAQEQARSEPAMQPTRDIKVISSAGARALADACTAWAEQNKKIVAMAILD